jgi:benzodiazapine receptor
MNRDVIRQICVLLALIVTIVVNVLSNAIPLNGMTAGEISDSFDILFVPAGYVFSIWSVIYLGLIAYAIFQLRPSERENPRLRRTGWWFVLSSAANSVWLFLWHYGYFGLSVVAMLTLLASLIVIYLRLGVGKETVSSGERWLVHLPFSVYLGWITVATIANITAFLDFVDWNAFGIAPETWTIIMLVVAIVVAALMAYDRQDIAYLLVLIWAFIGIGVEQADTPLVANAAYLAAGAVALLVIWVIIRKVRGSQTPTLATS